MLLKIRWSWLFNRRARFLRRGAANHMRSNNRIAALETLEARIVLASDFGDAPDTGTGIGSGDYQTLLANGGASHVIDTTQTTLFLGARVDGEADATPHTLANGDDITMSPDDEDGVIEPAQDLVLTVGTAPVVRARAGDEHDGLDGDALRLDRFQSRRRIRQRDRADFGAGSQFDEQRHVHADVPDDSA